MVFFYPKASTPGCTAEACNLRDNYAELQSKGFELLGVSADSEKRQTNFKNKYEFPFPLLADENKEVIEAFGVWGEKKFMGKTYDGIHRKTFLVNENGVVDHVIDKVKNKSTRRTNFGVGGVIFKRKLKYFSIQNFFKISLEVTFVVN